MNKKKLLQGDIFNNWKSIEIVQKEFIIAKKENIKNKKNGKEKYKYKEWSNKK